MKIAAVAPEIRLGDPRANTGPILSWMGKAHDEGASLLVLPSLCLCGCTCLSLWSQTFLRESCKSAAALLARESAAFPGLTVALPGAAADGRRYADILRGGERIKRVWMEEGNRFTLELEGECVCIALPETPATVESPQKLRAAAMALSRGGAAVVLTPGAGESGNDGVYTGGAAMAIRGQGLGFAEGGMLLCDISDKGESWPEEESAPVCPDPFFPREGAAADERCERILFLQSRALAARMQRSGCMGLVLGLSGGLDSAWTLLVGVEALGLLGLPRERLLAVTMPGFGTGDRTRGNAEILARELGVRLREIPIGEAVAQHLRAIGHDLENHNATYENAQARERTQILMDLANDENALVPGTGDLSELALGWCTYNGDHMSMYGPNGALPKSGVRRCVDWYARCRAGDALAAALRDILNTPVSPELLPGEEGKMGQSTEAILGPYELHDFFLWHFLREGASPAALYESACAVFAGRYSGGMVEATLRTFLRRFFTQQFKRSCSPDGPVLWEGVSLSPRGAWLMPSDMSGGPWLAELDRAVGK